MREARDVVAREVHRLSPNTVEEEGWPEGGCESCYRDATAIISALSSAGLAVVPVVPTDEMILALPLHGLDGIMGDDAPRVIWAKQVREDWAAMIAAALPPLASGGG